MLDEIEVESDPEHPATFALLAVTALKQSKPAKRDIKCIT